MGFLPEIIYGVIFILGNLSVWHWRRRQDDPDVFFFCSLFSVSSLFLYLGFTELEVGSFYLIVPLAFFGIFLLSYFRKKAQLLNGWLFNLFLISMGLYLFWNLTQTGSLIVGGILAVILVAAFLVLAFGFVALLIFLYWNSLVVLRKESHSLANLLTLLLAIFLTVYLLFDFFLLKTLPLWLSAILSFMPIMLFYFFIVFFNFFTVSLLYQFNHPRYQQDYIVVLGAGLLNGETVTPLLARRVDAGISFYKRQKQRTGKIAKLIMSGGQGADEKISEAQAMKNYALTLGVPEEDILLEDQSTNTLENMKFSKAVIENSGNQDYKAIFSSNNYHIFRAAIFADWAQLKADGIGAPTAFYYLPNAFLREYVAILMMNKRRHLVALVLILCFAILFTILTVLFN